MDSRKLHSICWEKIHKPIEIGGLGIKRLKEMNEALLAKLGWRMIKFPILVWVRVLRSKYGDPLVVPQKHGNVSQVWRGLLAGSTVLQEGLDRGPTRLGETCWKFTPNGQ